MSPRRLFPIPPNFLNFGLKALPIIIGLFGSIIQFSDYILSGALIKAAGFLPCCGEKYDFIIVGAGPSGSAIAARLSESPAVRVLLLEAGGDPNPYSSVPGLVPEFLNHPAASWQYRTIPQKNSGFGLPNQEVLLSKGKSLGGSSNIDYMIYSRGNLRDYDRWAEHTGDDRWRSHYFKKYFESIEDYFGHWHKSGFHRKGGPLRIETAKYEPGIEYILDAAGEMGFKVRDLNLDQRQGFSPVDFTQQKGKRFSSYYAYIKPNQIRNNLSVYRYTTATQIHLDNKLRAVGVTYLRHGVKGYAEATKEIIVCAGAINSPKLLMLSGIGIREELIHHRIPPLVNLPVGRNLQDHVTSVLGPFLLNDTSSFIYRRDMDVGAIYQYLRHGTGPLSSPMGITATGLASSSLASYINWPDIIFTVASVGIYPGFASAIDKTFNLGNLCQKYLNPDRSIDAHFVLVSVGQPKSRGSVRLKNGKPYSVPIIDPEYYSDAENHDRKVMVEGMEIVRRMYENTTTFRRLGAHLPKRHFPGCEDLEKYSPVYFECIAKTFTTTLHHPSGTCRMGKREDKTSVVDSQLRVIGVKNLRVADSSIMPFITNAHLNAPTIAIGEMCADMIKSDWKIR